MRTDAPVLFQLRGALHFNDEIGTELADDAAAREQAIAEAGELLQDHRHEIANASYWRMTVTDSGPEPVLILTLDLKRR